MNELRTCKSGPRYLFWRANISTNTVDTACEIFEETLPNLRSRRCRSTARSWSSATRPRLPWKVSATRVGYGRSAVVTGAMMTVRKYRLVSSGEITKQGRVFRISDH